MSYRHRWFSFAPSCAIARRPVRVRNASDPIMTSPAAKAAQIRRTFAIISHPDAGKTTLTERLLLEGGAIQLAGMVKAKGDSRRARSDWMAIEQSRGISVASAVMTFERDGLVFNLLDTPGHEDFSEDTYRTLTAVDCAIMVVDAAKGVEERTRKLFEVCKGRHIPILTFVNKMDREARDPFELLEEIEEALGIAASPALWPSGSGRDFLALYHLLDDRIILTSKAEAPSLGDAALDTLITPQLAAGLRENVELAGAACPAFDLDEFLAGKLTPVFFGTALGGVGVRELLDGVARLAPPPRPRSGGTREVDPGEPAFSGFVFKIQANMNPAHRDRVAFVRVCSGQLRKGQRLTESRTGKNVPVNAPMFFLAQDRAVIEEAWPGDIVGIANHGTLRIGDTLTEGEGLTFAGVPRFTPEILRRARLGDPMQGKKLRTALEHLAEEGVMQVYRPLDGSNWMVGVVGALQLDVLASRLSAEYGLDAGFEGTAWTIMRWVECDNKQELESFKSRNRTYLAEDHENGLAFFAERAWLMEDTMRDWPNIRFLTMREAGQMA